MNHVIPQQFNQSDKIGKFTMPQAVILAIFTCIFVLIVISSNFWISLFAFFPLAISAFTLMYFRINKIPIYEFIMIYIVYVGSPKLLLYRSDNLKSVEEIEEGIRFLEREKMQTPNKNPKKETSQKTIKKTTTKKRGKNPPRSQPTKKRGAKTVKSSKGVK